MIKDMWYARRSILKFEEDNKKRERLKKKHDKPTKSDPGPKRDIARFNKGKRGVSELRGQR